MKKLVYFLLLVLIPAYVISSCDRGGCGCNADLTIPLKDSNAILTGPDGESIFLESGNIIRSVCNTDVISQEIKNRLRNNTTGISINVEGLVGRTCSGKMQPAILPSGIRISSINEN